MIMWGDNVSEVLLTTDKLYKLKTEIEGRLIDIKDDSNMVKELKATMAEKYKALLVISKKF